MLTVPDQKEQLSLAYVDALAARAGFATSDPKPDRDSVDLRVMAGGRFRPALDLQLKATTALAEPRSGVLRFRLPVKNYNDLASRRKRLGFWYCLNCQQTRRGG